MTMPRQDRSPYGTRGRLVRLVYLGVALLWWAATLGGRRLGRRTVVLCYHGVSAAQRAAFAAQMRHIAARSRHGGARRPCVRVTFDDGFRNLLDHALPTLRELGIPALVFVVAGNLGRRPGWDMPADHPESAETLMSADELRHAAQNGLCRLGSHTVTHPRLTAVSTATLHDELAASKRAIEQLTDQPVEALAFPFGAFDARAVAVARAVGYRRAFTLEPRLFPADQPDGCLGRFQMSPAAWPIEFRLTCAGAYAWLHPWRCMLRFVRAGGRPAARREVRLA